MYGAYISAQLASASSRDSETRGNPPDAASHLEWFLPCRFCLLQQPDAPAALTVRRGKYVPTVARYLCNPCS